MLSLFLGSTVGSCVGLLIRMSLVRAQPKEPKFNARIAQLVVRHTCNVEVRGSNPRAGTIFSIESR